jgi:hypothetical protein
MPLRLAEAKREYPRKTLKYSESKWARDLVFTAADGRCSNALDFYLGSTSFESLQGYRISYGFLWLSSDFPRNFRVSTSIIPQPLLKPIELMYHRTLYSLDTGTDV